MKSLSMRRQSNLLGCGLPPLFILLFGPDSSLYNGLQHHPTPATVPPLMLAGKRPTALIEFGNYEWCVEANAIHMSGKPFFIFFAWGSLNTQGGTDGPQGSLRRTQGNSGRHLLERWLPMLISMSACQWVVGEAVGQSRS